MKTSQFQNAKPAEVNNSVIAAMGHMVQQWTLFSAHAQTMTDAEVLAAYEAIGEKPIV